MWESLKQWDVELLTYLNNLGSPNYDSLWIFITQIESWIVLFLLFTILIFYYYGWRKGIVVFLTILFTFGITLFFTDLTKENIERLRPNNVLELSKTLRILQHPKSYSFFSGHASSSFAITTLIVLVIRRFNKWIYLAILWPCLFVFSRIYVGVHFPSDILVGAMVGAVLAFLGYVFCKRILKFMD